MGAVNVAEVRLWGRLIGAVVMPEGGRFASFQYDPDFADSGIEVAKLKMPLDKRAVYSFPGLPYPTFKGLPGMLADSLPDKYGKALINAWLAGQGRDEASFTSIEQLCYIGSRGMGALEFAPATERAPREASQIDIPAMVRLASEILAARGELKGNLATQPHEEVMRDILLVGTSAGGARAKAVIAIHEMTKEIRSGQINVGEGYGYWIIKFDGITNNRDRELADGQGYGAIEYAYHKMALAAGIAMNECRLLEEGGRRHFMTRRFDRQKDGGKLHMQSLCALRHLDFHETGAHSYEQAFQTIRELVAEPAKAVEEMFRRMVFNIVARNQDDHVKNISFLMDKRGAWSLSPAYDVMYSYNPEGKHTSAHQMSMNGKRDHFTLDDFQACSKVANLKQGRYSDIIQEVVEAVSEWPKFASEARVDQERVDRIQAAHRLEFSRGS